MLGKGEGGGTHTMTLMARWGRGSIPLITLMSYNNGFSFNDRYTLYPFIFSLSFTSSEIFNDNYKITNWKASTKQWEIIQS